MYSHEHTLTTPVTCCHPCLNHSWTVIPHIGNPSHEHTLTTPVTCCHPCLNHSWTVIPHIGNPSILNSVYIKDNHATELGQTSGCSLSESAKSSPSRHGTGDESSHPSPATSPAPKLSPGGAPASASSRPSSLATSALTPNRSAVHAWLTCTRCTVKLGVDTS